MEQAQERSAVWHERLTAQQASGLSVAAWCQQTGVSAWSFYAWRKRLTSPKAGMPLMAVPMPAPRQALALELQTPGGYLLRLTHADQVAWLPAILAAVR